MIRLTSLSERKRPDSNHKWSDSIAIIKSNSIEYTYENVEWLHQKWRDQIKVIEGIESREGCIHPSGKGAIFPSMLEIIKGIQELQKIILEEKMKDKNYDPEYNQVTIKNY